MSIVPDEDQGIFHGMPAFKLRGKTIAGFPTGFEPVSPP
jgi:hypothetical protein